MTDGFSLRRRPLPLGGWGLSGERLPSLPAEHSTRENQLLLGLQDQLFGLSAVDGVLELLDAFVLEVEEGELLVMTLGSF